MNAMNRSAHSPAGRRRIGLPLLALVLLLGGARAQAAGCEALTIRDAHINDAPPGAPAMAGYLTLVNAGDSAVVIDGVSTAAFNSAAFHTMSMHNGVMHMQAESKLVVPAHGELNFAAGGRHLMLVGAKKPLAVGDSAVVTLHCGATHTDLTLPVQALQ